MPLTFARTLDHRAVLGAVDQLVDLVGCEEVAEAWEQESALAGMTVGGLTRHLVSQPECAVEFLSRPGPPDAEVLTLVGHYDRADWLRAPLDSPENTSIRDACNEMAGAGHQESVEALARARAELVGAIDAAGATTYVPWQDCALATDDFLVVRLMEGDRGARGRPGLERRRCDTGVRLRGARSGPRTARGARRATSRPACGARRAEPSGALGRPGLRVLTGMRRSAVMRQRPQ